MAADLDEIAAEWQAAMTHVESAAAPTNPTEDPPTKDGTLRLTEDRRWVQRGVPTRFVEEHRWVTEWENADAVRSAAAPTDTPHTST